MRAVGLLLILLGSLVPARAETLVTSVSNHRVLITVLRNGLMKQVVLDFSRDHSKE